MKQINLKIITPEQLVVERLVDQVTVPTLTGEITILPGHVSLIAGLKGGELVAMKDGESMPIAIAGGFLQVKPNEVIVLADFAVEAENITEEKIALAQKRAAEIAEKKDTLSKEDFEHFEAELERSLALSKVHGKWKDRRYKR